MTGVGLRLVFFVLAPVFCLLCNLFHVVSEEGLANYIMIFVYLTVVCWMLGPVEGPMDTQKIAET